MRLSRVFFDGELAVGSQVPLDKAQSHYLKNVLRLKPGAAFFLFDGRHAIDYRATLTLDGRQAFAIIESSTPLQTESALDSAVIQGLGRADHMDWMVQKTSELGVRRIAVFNAERTQAPLKSVQAEKKLAHWRGVAISACEQSGRAVLPQIEFHAALDQALSAVAADLRLLLEFEGPALADRLQHQSSASITILVGPEGGLTAEEIASAGAAGFFPVRLGPRVLRTETAATAALAIAQSTLGDLG